MDPGDLRVESFARYPPQARSLAATNLTVLKRMPLILLSMVLRQIIQYDWCFPAEREQLLLQFNLLNQMDAASFDALMAPFFTIPLSAELREMDWIDHPQQFSEHATPPVGGEGLCSHHPANPDPSGSRRALAQKSSKLKNLEAPTS